VLDGSGQGLLDDPIDRGLDVGHVARLRASRLVGEVHLERDPEARLAREALDELFATLAPILVARRLQAWKTTPRANDEIETSRRRDGVAGRLAQSSAWTS
jgi:hypothetical protein